MLYISHQYKKKIDNDNSLFPIKFFSQKGEEVHDFLFLFCTDSSRYTNIPATFVLFRGRNRKIRCWILPMNRQSHFWSIHELSIVDTLLSSLNQKSPHLSLRFAFSSLGVWLICVCICVCLFVSMFFELKSQGIQLGICHFERRLQKGQFFTSLSISSQFVTQSVCSKTWTRAIVLGLCAFEPMKHWRVDWWFLANRSSDLGTDFS